MPLKWFMLGSVGEVSKCPPVGGNSDRPDAPDMPGLRFSSARTGANAGCLIRKAIKSRYLAFSDDKVALSALSRLHS